MNDSRPTSPQENPDREQQISDPGALPPRPPRLPQIGELINPFSQPFVQPIFTYAMLGVIVVVFFVTIMAGLITNPNQVLYDFGASYGPNIIAGEVWRLFTSMFLHADVTHIMFNGFALYVLGPDMEKLFGHGRYIAVYLLTGLFGSLISFALSGPNEFSVGASGAIFGVIGMQLAFFTFYRGKLGKFGQERFMSMLRLVGINLVIGLLVVRINNTAHMAGLVSGFLLGYVLSPRYVVDQITSLGLKIHDQAGLPRTWWVVVMATALLIAGTYSAVLFWRG